VTLEYGVVVEDRIDEYVSLVTQENLHYSRVRYVVLSCVFSVIGKYIELLIVYTLRNHPCLCGHANCSTVSS
jgi:hypothetical protein